MFKQVSQPPFPKRTVVGLEITTETHQNVNNHNAGSAEACPLRESGPHHSK